MKMDKLVIYGDSISGTTHGNGGFQRILESRSIFDIIKNYAIGASGLSPGTPNNLYKLVLRYHRYDADASMILVWHGTNDWFYGVSVEDYKRNLKEIYSRLKAECPAAKFLFLTPIFRFETVRGNNAPSDAFSTLNLSGNTLMDFENVLIEMAEAFKEPYINMRLATNFNLTNALDFFEDYVHPNQSGYEMIGNIIIEKLKSL